MLGLPLLIATAPAGVVFLLGGTAKAFSCAPLRAQEKPQVRSPGPDSDGVPVSSSFLKALSCELVVSPIQTQSMLVFWCWFDIAARFGFGRSSCDVSSIRAKQSFLSASDTMFTPTCVRVMCCTPVCTRSSPSINERYTSFAYSRKKEYEDRLLVPRSFSFNRKLYYYIIENNQDEPE